MTLKKINLIANALSTLVMHPFEFGGITAQISCAFRARHSESWQCGAHCHPWFEFNFVSKGMMYTTLDGKEFAVNAGDAYIIPPWVVHSHRHDGCGDDGLCIRFSLNAPDTGIPLGEVLAALSAPHAEVFAHRLDRFAEGGDIYCMQAEFAAWLLRIASNWYYSGSSIAPASAPKTLSRQVMLYLKESFRSKVRTTEIANALNISYRTLSRGFSAETGMTVTEALTKLRIDEAKRLLQQSDMPLYAIAAAVGYENEFYFSRRFMEQEKISPAAYKKQCSLTVK